MDALLLGIISSLVATGLFIGISEIFRRVLVPWYADRIYRGVRIDGDWEAIAFNATPVPQDIEITFHLKQSGDRVSGAYAHKGPKGRRDTYQLTAVIRDGYLLAYATPISDRHMDAIALLLYIHTKLDDLQMTGAVLCSGEPGKVRTLEQLTFRLVGR
jgi:hypothetical protein